MRLDYLLKGILIGIGKIIPGFSGTVMMISFGLYDKAIDAITNYFNNIKKNTLFLINIGIGILIGIVIFSKIINYFISNYYIYTMSLFIGLILGSIPIIYKESLKNKTGYLLIIISFIIMILINNISSNNNYIVKNNYTDLIVFFISGIIEAIGTIIPGISSTALLMIIGVYNIYLNMLSSIFNINILPSILWFFIPFSMGLFISIIIISIIIDYLFKNHKEKTYSIIIGIVNSSSLILILRLFNNYKTINDIIVSFICLATGFYISRKI